MIWLPIASSPRRAKAGFQHSRRNLWTAEHSVNVFTEIERCNCCAEKCGFRWILGFLDCAQLAHWIFVFARIGAHGTHDKSATAHFSSLNHTDTQSDHS